MTQSTDGGANAPVRENKHDMQIDPETGQPVSIPPVGEKEDRPETVPPEERLRIDPESRIPRPVQPDLA